MKIAVISLIDSKRQWFKSTCGLGAKETPRDISFCGHAILQDGVFVIEDALQDMRFFDNPLVTGDPQIRFYAGAPLVASNGAKLGTLCLIDSVPRQLNAFEIEMLSDMAKLVMQEIEHGFLMLENSLH